MVIILLSVLTLSACSEDKPSNIEPTITVNQDDIVYIATPTPTVSAIDTPSPSLVPTPNPISNTYIMNKNYDLVPKDPNGDKKVVLLTFDDGPKEAEMLGIMLDILDKHQAKAIFFMNGYRIKANPDLLKLVYDRGQTIGNHSWDHIELKKETNESIEKQIKDVQQIVKDTIGIAPVFFRPPFASSNDHVRKVAKQEKLLYMTWSNGSLDWELKSSLDEAGKSAAIIKNVMDQLHKGSNILMHELPWTAAALDSLLTQLEQEDYSFLDPIAIDTQLE